MTAVPLPPVLLIAGFALLVTVLRYVFVREGPTDRLINRALGLAGVGMLVALATARPDTHVFLRHLGAVTGSLTASSVYGVARLLDGADPRVAYRRQRRYDLIAVAATVVTVLVDAAVLLGALPDWCSDRWYAAGTIGSCVPLAVSGFLLIRAGVREIRSPDTRLAPRLAYVALMCVAAFWIGYAVVLFVRSLSGVPPTDPGKAWALTGFGFFALIAALLALPLVDMALERTGLDRPGRDCRRLRPLWTDLIAAVPHIALTPEDAHRRASEPLRYRMVVEIRDALLHLRRHGADQPTEVGARTMRALARAEDAVGPVPDAGAGHDAELRYLLELAAEWPRAGRSADAVVSAARASR